MQGGREREKERRDKERGGEGGERERKEEGAIEKEGEVKK